MGSTEPKASPPTDPQGQTLILRAACSRAPAAAAAAEGAVSWQSEVTVLPLLSVNTKFWSSNDAKEH